MLRIGSVQLDFPVVQAALSGYSDGPMRLIARRLGAPYALHELVLDQFVIQSSRRHKDGSGGPASDDHPIGGQLLGSEPDQLAEAAAWMVRAGYDVIDVNFACPVRRVLARGRGGFLLSNPRAATDILRAVRAAVPPDMPVTLKMRRGMDDSPDSPGKFFEILEAAFELGLNAVTVHARTVEQGYRGPSDWGFLAQVKRHVADRTVLGSGDLFSAEDIRRMLDQTGVNGVTVARGCIGNPWIFGEARALLSGKPLPPPPSVGEQGRVLSEHFELALATHGPRRGVRVMRKFGIKYAELHPCATQVRAAFIGALNLEQWLAVLATWYDPGRDWPPGVRKGPPHRPTRTRDRA
jgi:nifR3 family TIM-barrel protein